MKTLKEFKAEADTTYEILSELDRHDSYEIFSDKEVKTIWKHLKEKSYINLNDIPTFYSVLGSDNYRSYSEITKIYFLKN